ncbi:MAG: pilus assembly protein [Gemmataceae bacterium]|nr:pilus assembly protein [Gemmataceae bacterium]
MILIDPQRGRRTAVAAVEFAVILPLLFMLLAGVLEVARLVQVTQIAVFAAREGARTASQGVLLLPNGATTNILVSGSDPSVADSARTYLTGSGLNRVTTTNVTDTQLVNFVFTSGTYSGVSGKNPSDGSKGDYFKVTVTVPWQYARWSTLQLLNPNSVIGEATGVMMVDKPLGTFTDVPTWVEPS